MQKVGILTYHSSYNFGANLQTLAMQRALEMHGLSSVVIDYRDPVKSSLYRQITPPAQAEAHERFIERHLSLSPRFTDAAAVAEYCAEALDGVVVGSDAVFRLVPAWSLGRGLRRLIRGKQPTLAGMPAARLSPYWLEWPRPRGRRMFKVSIAASATGTRFYQLRPSLYPMLWSCLRDFDYLSVRDGWTMAMVRTLSAFSRHVDLCPDPVFSLPIGLAVSGDEQPTADLSRTVLLSGAFEGKWRAAFVRAAHRATYSVASLPNPDDDFAFEEADIQLKRPMGPLEWYQTLAQAAGFVGIRYHAFVSCLANGTPVVTVDQPHALEPGHRLRSRAWDVCRRAGISQRYVYASDLQRMDPEVVLQKLFDPETQKRANAYARVAQAAFLNTVSTVEHIAKTQAAAQAETYGKSTTA